MKVIKKKKERKERPLRNCRNQEETKDTLILNIMQYDILDGILKKKKKLRKRQGNLNKVLTLVNNNVTIYKYHFIKYGIFIIII